MASKKKQEPKNSRRWTECELEIFADVLAEPENCFAVTLEKLALKKSSNNEVFDHIQNAFVSEMAKEEFQLRNIEHFKDKRITKLDTCIEKLRIRYKWLKSEWSAKTTRAKNGSGFDPDDEPNWYKILNPVFTETHQPLNLVSSAADTSFLGGGNFAELSSDDDDDDIATRSNSASLEDIGQDADGSMESQGDREESLICNLINYAVFSFSSNSYVLKFYRLCVYTDA